MLRVLDAVPRRSAQAERAGGSRSASTVFLVAMILVRLARGLTLGLVELIAAYLIEPVGIPAGAARRW